MSGVLSIVLAVFLFSTMGALIKAVGAGVPVFEVVLFRNVITAVVVGFLLVRQGVEFRGVNKMGLALRSLMGIAAMGLDFWAITKIPLPEVALLRQTAPLFVALLAGLVLRERFPRSLVLWLVLGFVGVMLVLRPGFGPISLGQWAALGSGLLSGAVYVSLRHLSTTEPPLRIVFHFTSWGSLISLPIAASPFVIPAPKAFVMLVAIGLIGTAAQLLLTKAYRLEKAAIVGSFHYLGVVFSALYGWLFWDERLTVLSALGGVLIVLCGAMVHGVREKGSTEGSKCRSLT